MLTGFTCFDCGTPVCLEAVRVRLNVNATATLLAVLRAWQQQQPRPRWLPLTVVRRAAGRQRRRVLSERLQRRQPARQPVEQPHAYVAARQPAHVQRHDQRHPHVHALWSMLVLQKEFRFSWQLAGKLIVINASTRFLVEIDVNYAHRIGKIRSQNTPANEIYIKNDCHKKLEFAEFRPSLL
jgi:hypothetical protein